MKFFFRKKSKKNQEPSFNTIIELANLHPTVDYIKNLLTAKMKEAEENASLFKTEIGTLENLKGLYTLVKASNKDEIYRLPMNLRFLLH